MLVRFSGYEVYVSLVDAKAGYKWVVYTVEGDAGVGLADGLAPWDNWASSKQTREASGGNRTCLYVARALPHARPLFAACCRHGSPST